MLHTYIECAYAQYSRDTQETRRRLAISFIGGFAVFQMDSRLRITLLPGIIYSRKTRKKQNTEYVGMFNTFLKSDVIACIKIQSETVTYRLLYVNL